MTKTSIQWLPLALAGIATFIFVLIFIPLVLFHHKSATLLTKSDIAGIYHVSATNFYGHLPTNFSAFAIKLNADGSFVATNVPADFFFDYTPTPAVPDAKGSWELSHESWHSLSYTGENDYLILHFQTAPGPGVFTRLIEVNSSEPEIRMDYHANRNDATGFYLQKVTTD